MDPRILHDNKKLEDDDETLLIIDRIYSSDVLTLPQTDLPVCIVNSSNNEKQDYSIVSTAFEERVVKKSFRFLQIAITAFKEWMKKMSIVGNSSSHSTSNEEFSRLPIICAKKDNDAMNCTSQPDNNELHMRKEIVQCLSSYVLSTDLFLGILYKIWSSVSSWDDDLFIWMSMLGLFGFMVFVCAVVVMILVRAPFTSMQKVMLVFWVILLHLQSVNSVSDVCVTLVGALLMVWYVFGRKKAPQYEEVI